MLTDEQLIECGREEARFKIRENFEGAGGFFKPWTKAEITAGLRAQATAMSENEFETPLIWQGMEEELAKWNER